MQNLYSALLPTHGHVLEETKAPFQLFKERHLQAMWLEQKYFHPLVTSAGETVKVISPGIWNQSAGPDFLKAHLVIGNAEVFGDVELHLSPNDWYYHGHQRDPRYNQVVLHVSLWDQKKTKPITSLSGKTIPHVSLENRLTCQLSKLTELIDIDLYPYQTFSGSGKCANLLFKDLTDHQTLEFFQSAAAWRLHQKNQNIAYRVEDFSLRFHAGLSMALGYKNNTEIFLQMFLWLYPLREIGEEAILALALGASGVFENKGLSKWGGGDYYQRMHALYAMLAITYPIPTKYDLVSHQVRPLNHPIRRLACLAKLLTDENLSKILQSMIQVWNKGWQNPKKWSSLKKDWLTLLPCYTDPHWSSHYLFENEPKAGQLPMIGNSLKQEMLVNVFFPLLSQEILERSQPKELESFKNFYHTFSTVCSGKTKYLTHRFFGESPKKQLLKKVDVEQGAFQLHRDFCIHYESSCEGCPFIENYKKKFKIHPS